jgi:hypothetical protein
MSKPTDNKTNQQDIDAMTHPSVYRDTINCKVGQKIDGDYKCTPQEESGYDNWDLYPQMIRKIENEGSPKDVEHLHQLERTPSK